LKRICCSLTTKKQEKSKSKKKRHKKKGECEKNKVERQKIKVAMENIEGLKKKKFNEQWSIKINWNNG
jgi:hypothetical protein